MATVRRACHCDGILHGSVAIAVSVTMRHVQRAALSCRIHSAAHPLVPEVQRQLSIPRGNDGRARLQRSPHYIGSRLMLRS